MDSRAPKPPGESNGYAGVRWLSHDTLEIVQKGYLTREIVEGLHRQLKAQTQGRKVTWVLSETSEVTGMDSAIVGPGGKLVEELKRLGARKVIVIAKSSVVRVTASALFLASKVSVKLVATRAEAEQYMASIST
jgi:hypothetical protein